MAQGIKCQPIIELRPTVSQKTGNRSQRSAVDCGDDEASACPNKKLVKREVEHWLNDVRIDDRQIFRRADAISIAPISRAAR